MIVLMKDFNSRIVIHIEIFFLSFFSVAVKTALLLLFNLIGFLKYQYGYMDRDTINLESCVHFKVHVQSQNKSNSKKRFQSLSIYLHVM